MREREATAGSSVGRHALDLDNADIVLPPTGPPVIGRLSSNDLWHPEAVAELVQPPAPRGKLAFGLVALAGATVGACGYAGTQLAIIGGLGPPSPPRYVLTNQPTDGLGQLHDPQRPATAKALAHGCEHRIPRSDRAARSESAVRSDRAVQSDRAARSDRATGCDRPSTGRHRLPAKAIGAFGGAPAQTSGAASSGRAASASAYVR